MSEHTDSHATDEHDHGEHDHGGVGKYLVVFAMLCVLTLISFWIGNSSLMENAKLVAMVGMMVVSCAKAMLVLLIFMHLKWEANWKYVLTFPAGMMSIFLMLMLVPDVGMRMRHYTEERLEHAARVPAESHAKTGDGHSKTVRKTVPHK